MYKLLLVEDDEQLCKKLGNYLRRWGYDIYTIEAYDKIMERFCEVEPHLVLMDINLPYFDGFHWCNRIRQVSKCPIIFLSSRDADMDIIMAMNAGGDDYLNKPFSVDVLNAKVTALLRRTYDYKEQGISTYAIGEGIYNQADHSIAIHGTKYDLTKNESRILYTLIQSKGEIVSRDAIMNALWDDDQYVNDNTLTKNINRLRKKLEDMGLAEYILTKKGEGYMIS